MQKMMKSCVVILMCLVFATMAIAGEVKTWTEEELANSEKLVKYGKIYQDTGLEGFSTAKGVMNDVLKQAASDNVENVTVISAEIKALKKFGIVNNFNVVEVYGIYLLEPNQENIENTLKNERAKNIEINSALKHLKSSPNKKEIAKVILARINNSKFIHNNSSDKLCALFINTYSDIMQNEAEQGLMEWQKNTKFHGERSWYAAGEQLIKHSKNSPNKNEIAKILLTRIKSNSAVDSSAGDKFYELYIDGYAEFMQKEAAPELTKLLKFHNKEGARIAAGRQLIKIGQSASVEEVLAKSEKSNTVKAALNKALME